MPITIDTVTELTDGIVKSKYENNSNTNAYTDTEKTKLANIEDNATADQSDAEIETAYNNQVDVVSQVDAEAGTSTDVYRWTPERVAQAIAALAGAALVDSVNGETGVVVLDAGDIDVVDSGDNYTATDVEGILAEIAPQLGSGGSADEVALASGDFTARIGYIGASAPTISSPSTGNYTITIPSGTMFLWGNMFGNSTTLDTGELNLSIDNSANSANRWFSAQLLDANNGGLVDPHAASVNYTQTITSNVTTIVFPGFIGNGTNGYRIMLS